MNNRPIFRDADREQAFRQNGFVKVPFFGPEEISILSKLCERLDGQMDTGFTTTIWSSDPAYRIAVYEELKKIYLPHISSVLKDCKLVMGTILTKQPSASSGLDIHQDWAFTDEEKYTAVNIWVPLVDASSENGALCFLPFSQMFDVPYRGRHITPQFNSVKDRIWKLAVTCPADAGEAVIFDVKMVHYSNPNTSGHIRTAVSMVAIPDEAPILHYINYDQGKNVITEMEVNTLFYNSFSHDDNIPQEANARKFEYRRDQLDIGTFEREYKQLLDQAEKP